MGNISRLVNPVNRTGDLTVANAQLHILREQLRQRREDLEQNLSIISTVSEPCRTAETPALITLPPHLGWGSERVPTKPNSVPSRPRPTIEITVIPVDDIVEEVEEEDTSNGNNGVLTHTQTFSIHPSLLVAFLKNEVAAIGRIWLLAKSLDRQGRGWLTIDELRQQLTDKSSPLRVCGWRRLRQILGAGKGIFWEWDPSTRLRTGSGRIWLYGTIRVAHNLNVTHFSGDAIALPVRDLLGTIGDVRAAFYTAFHCGRDSNPISRATLQIVTGVPERTQRHYDNAHNTERVSNFSLVTDAGDQETAWQHGRAAFTFTDNLGKHGAAGKRYTAIRLPNSYTTTRYASLSGKRKRLNHKLKQDLANHGTQGNSNGQVRRLFFTDGQQAAQAFNRDNDVYLCDQGSRNVIFWAGWSH